MNAALLLAATTTCGMALYHFLLPFVWGWAPFLATLPPAVRWGSYSINFFFSFLLLGGGLLTILVWRTAGSQRSMLGRAILIMMFALWVANVAYQLIIPMPLPPGLIVARLGFIGFAALTAAAHAIPAFRRRRNADGRLQS